MHKRIRLVTHMGAALNFSVHFATLQAGTQSKEPAKGEEQRDAEESKLLCEPSQAEGQGLSRAES